MARTKPRARRGPESKQYRENMKTPEGRALNDLNKKRKHRNDAEHKPTSQHRVEDPESQRAKRLKDNKSSPPDQPATAQAADTDGTIFSKIPPPACAPDTSIDLSNLVYDATATHDVTTMSIISSSHIQQKVKRILELLLAVYPAVPPAKPNAVLLHAKASVASKMISIVEIAKREISKDGGKWFQYSIVEQRMVEQSDQEKRTSVAGSKDKPVGEDAAEPLDEAEDPAEGFETMKTPFERAIEGKAKVRAVPTMIICLSRVRIDNFKNSHGEQTNSLALLKKT